MLHAEIHEGSVFTGKHSTLWDLGEDDLKTRILDPRAEGREVWLEGQPFNWETSVLRIYDGPPTSEIPDFSRLLGPGAYAATGALQEVTDRYIQGPPGEAEANEPPAERAPAGEAIFVVHGANVAWREEVARFLQQVAAAAHPVAILHEQDNRGQTIVEKLEAAAARARYAVVLLTGDDEGRRRGDDRLQMRARQNVVFELGYFMAHLGRQHTCVLYETGVELPSDISGVVYVQLDEAGGWKLKLFKELRGAGLDVDLERLVS